METGPPNRSVKLPWVAPLPGKWRMKTYLTLLSGVLLINLLLLFSIVPTGAQRTREPMNALQAPGQSEQVRGRSGANRRTAVQRAPSYPLEFSSHLPLPRHLP